MRTCSGCQQTKSEAEFSTKTPGKLQSLCRPCVKIYNKEYYAQNKARYVEKARRRNAQQREELRALIDDVKNRPCADCGVHYPPWIMEFDHLEAGQKLANVSDMRRWAYSTQTVLEEIAKCDVVCSNCHRQRTNAFYRRNLFRIDTVF